MTARQKKSVLAGPRRRGRPPGAGLLADREDLLTAAESLIRSTGPDVTMEALAAAANVTKPILYRNVGDRDAVVAALADRFVTRINAAASSVFDAKAAGRTQIHRVITSYLEVVADERNIYLFVVSDGSGSDGVMRVLQLADRSAKPFGALLRHIGVADADAATLSYAFIGALQFATFRWFRDADQALDELADQLTDLWWSGISGAVRTPKHRP
ncbi:MAG: TetR/AcrR family transcriptional regulator [Ilumatobacteraceae bacterium]